MGGRGYNSCISEEMNHERGEKNSGRSNGSDCPMLLGNLPASAQQSKTTSSSFWATGTTWMRRQRLLTALGIFRLTRHRYDRLNEL
jgi:hypothetical protein